MVLVAIMIFLAFPYIIYKGLFAKPDDFNPFDYWDM